MYESTQEQKEKTFHSTQGQKDNIFGDKRNLLTSAVFKQVLKHLCFKLAALGNAEPL